MGLRYSLHKNSYETTCLQLMSAAKIGHDVCCYALQFPNQQTVDSIAARVEKQSPRQLHNASFLVGNERRLLPCCS